MKQFDKVLQALITECQENINFYHAQWRLEASQKEVQFLAQYWQDRKQTLLEVQELRKECGN